MILGTADGLRIRKADGSEVPGGIGVTFYGLDRQSELTLRKAISELEARYQP